MNTGGSLLVASLCHTAQSFFVIVNDGISGPQQTWLVAICNLAVVLILVLLSGLVLRRGTSEPPAVVDVKQPAAPQPEA